jgi:hypothetical protein
MMSIRGPRIRQCTRVVDRAVAVRGRGGIPSVAVCLVAAVLEGCASTPPVTYRYYPAQASTTFTVTQTIDCDASQTKVVTVNTPQATTAYTANVDANPYTLPIKGLDGWFADSDIAVKLTDDGRLQSINQSTTGQGETILKSAVTFAAAAAALGGGAPVKAPGTPQPLPECVTIKSFGGGKPVTLIYTLVVDWNKDPRGGIFLASRGGVDLSNDKGLFDSLKGQLPTLEVMIHDPSVLESAASYTAGTSDSPAILLTLQQVAAVPVDFIVQGQTLARSDIMVPQQHSTYELPIPKAALFGKQSFSLSLADSGAITSIEYGKNTGAASVVNVLGSAATAAAPETTAAKAADVKAEADLIAQQQRLARCQAKPAACQ